MDQQKIGSFLRELRREKGLTQEQLAEIMQVTNRTVSRWETGTNMPDISLLVELADYYEVDIREIIDGERKGEKMNEETKETVQKVADYATEKEKFLLRRVGLINAAGLISGLLSMLLPATSEVLQLLKGCTAGMTLGTIICTLLYITGVLAWIRKDPKRRILLKTIGIAGTAVTVLCIIFVALLSQ